VARSPSAQTGTATVAGEVRAMAQGRVSLPSVLCESPRVRLGLAARACWRGSQYEVEIAEHIDEVSPTAP
jgi:hypothetical protein